MLLRNARVALSSSTTTAVAVALIAGSAVPAQAAVTPALAPTLAATAAPVTDVTSLVDPFVSTEDDFGQDLPGAQAPNSLIKINPMTTPDRAHSGYDYAEDQIAGFTHTNLDGVGGSGGAGDLLVVPTYTDYAERPSRDSYAKGYSHDAEEASPGYYSVDLETAQGTITAEATADTRTGQDRFAFEQAGEAALVVDLANNFTNRRGASLEVTALPDGRASLAGDVVGFFNGYEYQLHYYAETTEPTAAVRTWGASQALSASTMNREGTDIGAILDFDVDAGEHIGLRVAISTISAEQARTDLAAEMGDRTFDEVRADTLAAWDALLSRVAIETSADSDPDGTLSKLFYTHLYRMLASPVNATSTSGTYRGLDGTVRKAEGYTHYDGWGFWDDFRKYEAIAIAYPDIYADMAQSIVNLFGSFTASGASRLGDLTHSVPTVRFERAAVVIADAIAKGAQLNGLDEAWVGLKRESVGRYADQSNVELGYIANEVDETLGTAYDDWAMSTIAEAIGHTDEAAAYLDRATNWVNVFKPDAVELPDGTRVGLNTPRRADGSFLDVDPERFQDGNLYQGTLWQYHWYMAADMGGLIEMMGGKENTLKALSYMFGEQAPDEGSRMLHSNANEIDLQSPYLFNYVGAPSKTQHWVRSIYTKETWNRYIGTNSTSHAPSGGGEFTPPVKQKVYQLDPQGFLPTMDNDTGTMSSMFVAAGLGLFPVQAGSDEYQIGSPFFERTTITYPSGKTFTISADGVSADSYYIQSATLNGASFDRTWVTYDQMMAGGELAFTMGSEPSDWAADGVAPPSLSDRVDSSIYQQGSDITLDSREFVEANSGDGAIGNVLTLSLAEGAFAGADGDDLAASGAIEAEGVPIGLTLAATRVDDTTVELSLTGEAESHGRLDSIDDLRVTLTDAAFAQHPASDRRAFDLKVTFVGATLSAERLTMTADAEGVLEDSVTLTLSGARFAGSDGRDLIADGVLALRGLPAGLSAQAEKIGPSSLALRVQGTLQSRAGENLAGGSFALAFSDAAFEGVAASTVGGDGVGLSTFTVAIDQQWRSQLSALYDEVKHIVKGAYASVPFAAFDDARTQAAQLLADDDATESELKTAYYALETAVGNLGIAQSPYRKMQAEESDNWSGGDLARESSTDSNGVSLGNLGGVSDGSWIAFGDVNFDEAVPENVTVRYVNNSGRCSPDSRVELRLDAPDGQLVDTVALPATGSNWNAYATTTHTLTDPSLLEGSHTLYLVFAGSTTDSRPWIGNFDWIQFGSDGDAADPHAARIEAEGFTSNNGNGLKTETSTDDAGNQIGNVGGTWDGGILTYENVDLSARAFSTVSVRYANNSGRTGSDARVEIRVDDVASEPIATVPLPSTGNSWSAYRTITVGLPTSVTGTHTLIVTMRAETDSGHPYVSNFDWFEFAGADFAELRGAIAAAEAIEGDGDLYIPADFAVFERALHDARVTAADVTSSQTDVDESLRVLTAAQGQLEWTIIRELAALITEAEALDTTAYSERTIAALNQAITDAKQVPATATHAEYTAARDALASAIERLAPPTVPAQPAAPQAALTGAAAITVTWEEVADDGGSDITEYVVTLVGANGEIETVTAEADATTAEFSGLDAGATYTATVTAVNGIGAGAASAASDPVTTQTAPEPPVADGDDLPDDARGLIDIVVVDGTVTVSGLEPTHWHFLYVYSEPIALGWFEADAEGTLTATLPTNLEAGTHRLAVQNADGELLGWTEFVIESGSTGPGGGSDGDNGADDDLAATGQNVPIVLLVVAGVLLVGGAIVLIVRRRRRE
ncbi:glycoside hydrolase domain-containing protein [Microbacterium sp.]|uniref:glycoside hydrolase domain-containing protein n=1 Tax=Microbacterium sp. TaxID=51671 RepID=UPI002608D2A0|nr:glycoside hydrolase domain-containing protein [Microbacterium sp.]